MSSPRTRVANARLETKLIAETKATTALGKHEPPCQSFQFPNLEGSNRGLKGQRHPPPLCLEQVQPLASCVGNILPSVAPSTICWHNIDWFLSKFLPLKGFRVERPQCASPVPTVNWKCRFAAVTPRGKVAFLHRHCGEAILSRFLIVGRSLFYSFLTTSNCIRSKKIVFVFCKKDGSVAALYTNKHCTCFREVSLSSCLGFASQCLVTN